MVTVEAVIWIPRMSANWVVFFQPPIELIKLKSDQAS